MSKKNPRPYPLLSIITCVYNGEKYISRLLQSVVDSNYPNIEHIIVNDGSTDLTRAIVEEYSIIYKKQTNRNLNVVLINQDNHGLGYSTNIAIKHITGDYWTWINCDDWYEKNAFSEAISFLIKKKNIDYIQLNGNYVYGSKKEIIIKSKNAMHFSNKKKLYIEYCYGEKMKYLLFICRTTSYKHINPSMSIYPSRYTQDEQFIIQLFPNLKGSFYAVPSWNFTIRDDSYLTQIKKELAIDYPLIFKSTINSLPISNKRKHILLTIYEEEKLLMRFKKESHNHKTAEAINLFKMILKKRKCVPIDYRLYLDKKLLLYLVYCFFVSNKN